MHHSCLNSSVELLSEIKINIEKMRLIAEWKAKQNGGRRIRREKRMNKTKNKRFINKKKKRI